MGSPQPGTCEVRFFAQPWEVDAGCGSPTLPTPGCIGNHSAPTAYRYRRLAPPTTVQVTMRSPVWSLKCSRVQLSTAKWLVPLTTVKKSDVPHLRPPPPDPAVQVLRLGFRMELWRPMPVTPGFPRFLSSKTWPMMDLLKRPGADRSSPPHVAHNSGGITLAASMVDMPRRDF